MQQAEFGVTVLGIGGALYAHGRHPSGQVVQIKEHRFLVDCGEGTQFQLKNFGISPFAIREIFITHLHGDHYFGLIGLISSMLLQGRTKPLTIFSPNSLSLEKIIRLQLNETQKTLSFTLRFAEVSTKKESHCIFENDDLSVWSLPLQHRLPASGYLFKEKPGQRKMIKEKIEEYDLTIEQIKAIKRGENIRLNGRIIPAKQLSTPPDPPRSFAYCSDTVYLPHLAKAIKSVNLLYHESTFSSAEKAKAQRTQHSTAAQAATIARDAGVGKLLIGHFSTIYPQLDKLLEEAKAIFPNTYLAEEGRTYRVK